MKQVKKLKIGKTPLLLLILLSSFVLLIAATLIINAIIKEQEQSQDPPQLEDGEALYLNQALAYPYVSEGDILSLLVQNGEDIFDFTRLEENGSFWLGYGKKEDGIEGMIQYIPPIAQAEGGFEIESLYAIEENDGYGQIYLLTYLCTAIGMPMFDERIELPTGADEKSKNERLNLLEEYGLDEKNAVIVSFAYQEKGEDGNVSEKTHSLVIGKKAITGSGFYYRVDGRDFIYYTSSNYFEYALYGFHSFVKGMLVAEGLDSDLTYEPYLTTDFKEWINEMHDKNGDKVEAGSKVIANGIELTPIIADIDAATDGSDGYKRTDSSVLTFDLSSLAAHKDFARIEAILTTLSVGADYTNDTEKVIITLVDELYENEGALIDFSKKESAVYTYTITAIESLIDGKSEISKEGTAVGGYDLLKVSYTLKVNGKSVSDHPLHAILDLTDTHVPTAAVGALRAENVGKLDEAVSFDITYTKKNSTEVKLVVEEITRILDKRGAVAEKVDESCYVTFVYSLTVNGKQVEKGEDTVSMEKIADSKKWSHLESELMGKKKGKLDTSVANEPRYYEIMRGFSSYEIERVECFVTSELVASFRFANPSERDPYFGESLYENTLDNKYKLYGVNTFACEGVVRFFGGITENGSSNHSDGFSGKTVALGLTHENMKEYGLYAYTVYFELPRGIYDAALDAPSKDNPSTMLENLTDYAWYGTLGFTLYISEPTERGTRYVGSDMYDLIAEVKAEDMGFLDMSFVDYWARKNLLLADIAEVDEIGVEFYMNDVYGIYDFDITKRQVYLVREGGKVTPYYQKPEGLTYTEATQYVVGATASSDSMDTKLKEYLDTKGTKEVSLTTLYNYTLNGGNKLPTVGYVDTVGVSNFKAAYSLLMSVRYQGSLSEEEQKEALSGKLLMRLRVKMEEDSSLYYTYDFYRLDDRRVMVSLYRADKNGKASDGIRANDFYISTYSFKLLVGTYMGLVNGEELKVDEGYPES